jgi:hypothetical protein
MAHGLVRRAAVFGSALSFVHRKGGQSAMI